MALLVPPGLRPIDVVVLVPARAMARDPHARATGAGPVEELDETLPRADGRSELRREVVQRGVRVGGTPAWFEGPAPIEVQRAVVGPPSAMPTAVNASLAERRKKTLPAVAHWLYDRREHRAAVPGDQPAGMPGIEIRYLELLRFAPIDGVADALLLVHARVGGADHAELVRGLRALAPRQSGDRSLLEHLVRGTGTLAPPHVPLYHLAFLSPRQPLPELDAVSTGAGWRADEQWLWTLSTLQSRDTYTSSENNLQQVRDARRTLSGDWDLAVMRRGAAIVARPLDDQWFVPAAGGRPRLEFVAEVAPLLAHSLFADALALGVVKRLQLDAFYERLADLDDPVARPDALAEIDRDFTHFRNRAWGDVGQGQATLVLRNYDAAQGTEARFDRLATDFAHYSQKVERDAVNRSNEISQGSNALIGLVTCFGVPLGALQVFGLTRTWVWIVVGAYMAGLGVLPAGDQVIGSIVPAAWREKLGGWSRVIWAAAWAVLIAALLVAGIIPAKAAPATP